MELILFDKYLIRTVDNSYLFHKVLNDKEPAIIENPVGKQKRYSNFSEPVYPTNFKMCLKKIKDLEIKDSNVTTLDELFGLLKSIDKKIDLIWDKFNNGKYDK